METHPISNEELQHLEEDTINKILPNQSNLNKQYGAYRNYTWINKKKITTSYWSSKRRDKERDGLVRMSKEQFMEKVRRDKLIK